MSRNDLDRLGRTFAASPSRRAALRALGALAVGRLAVALGHPGSQQVEAAPRKRHRHHHHHRCLHNTPPFTTPKHHCHADTQCCAS